MNENVMSRSSTSAEAVDDQSGAVLPSGSWRRTGIFLDVPNWETGLHDWAKDAASSDSRAHDVTSGSADLLCRSIRGIWLRVAAHGQIVMARAHGRCYTGNGTSTPPKGPTSGLLAADREGFVTTARFVSNVNGGKAEDVDMPLFRDVADAVYCDRLDTVVVVSGDGDMAYVAETVKGRGKRFVTMFWPGSGSQRLLAISDDVLALDALRTSQGIVGSSESGD